MWRRVSGSSQQYENTDTGERISRRQYDKTYGILKKQGYTSYEGREKARNGVREVSKRGFVKYQHELQLGGFADFTEQIRDILTNNDYNENTLANLTIRFVQIVVSRRGFERKIHSFYNTSTFYLGDIRDWDRFIEEILLDLSELETRYAIIHNDIDGLWINFYPDK